MVYTRGGIDNMKNYQTTLEKCKAEHGNKFNASDLDPRFIRFYESGERIKVETLGETLTGTIGKTTGWKEKLFLRK